MSNASLYLSRAARTSLLAPDSAPSRPPQHTQTPAPSSAARSRLRMTLASANRRTSRSLAVNAPSLNIGCENRLVVAVVTTRPVSASARRKSAIRRSRSAGRVEAEHVVVVEVDPVRTQFSELEDGPVGGHRRPYRRPEDVGPLPPHRPDAEREP